MIADREIAGRTISPETYLRRVRPVASRSIWSLLLDRLDEQHFWFATLVSGGLIVGMGIHAIDASAGTGLLGMLIGHYLGKQSRKKSE